MAAAADLAEGRGRVKARGDGEGGDEPGAEKKKEEKRPENK